MSNPDPDSYNKSLSPSWSAPTEIQELGLENADLRRQVAELRKENKRARDLLRRSCRYYHGAENMDGKPLQWIGVHVVRWHEHPPLPDVGFVQWNDDEITEALAGKWEE